MRQPPHAKPSLKPILIVSMATTGLAFLLATLTATGVLGGDSATSAAHLVMFACLSQFLMQYLLARMLQVTAAPGEAVSVRPKPA